MFRLKQLLPCFLKIFLLFNQLLFITSCGNLEPLPSNPIRKFEIMPLIDVNSTIKCNNNSKLTLQIMPSKANFPYNSTKMFYSEAKSELANYSYNQWVTLPQNMFTQLMEEKITNSCIYSNVIDSGILLVANYRLATNLIELKQTIHSNGSSTISLIFNMQLINNKDPSKIKSKIFIEKIEARASPEGFIDGANHVTSQLLEDLIQWLKQDDLLTTKTTS